MTFIFKLVYADNEGLKDEQKKQSSKYAIGIYQNLWIYLTYVPNGLTLTLKFLRILPVKAYLFLVDKLVKR